jgi:epoxyqueuosine reductase
MAATMAERVKEKARELGFSMAGIVAAQPGRTLAAYLDWVAQEYHGLMGYMARPDRVERRQDLNAILPGVQSLICVGLDYATMAPPPEIAEDPGRGRISNYAWGADYHDVMAPRLEALAGWLAGEAGAGVSSRVYVDTGAILERDHAAAAGMGFVGKNTMLIGPRRGSWFFLGELLTTLPLEPDSAPAAMPGCGSCRRCLDACPTSAFPRPYVLDARRCISYLTIELKEWIPRELRPLMGNWVYGCDVCQIVCPFNRFARPAREPSFYPESWDAVLPPLPDLLRLDTESFLARFAHSPIKRIRRERLVRNACVAAGNWGDPAALPALLPLLGDESPLVRGHAAWATGEIGGEPGRAALLAALDRETDVRVHEELSLALEEGSGDGS